MAGKSKKKTKSKGSSNGAPTPKKSGSPFAKMVGAAVIMLAGIFMLSGGFGVGGALPVNLFKGLMPFFGGQLTWPHSR